MSLCWRQKAIFLWNSECKCVTNVARSATTEEDKPAFYIHRINWFYYFNLYIDLLRLLFYYFSLYIYSFNLRMTDV